MVNVAIMGHGVVGSGVAEILINHRDRVSEKSKDDINVKYILDLRDFDGLPYSDKFIKDFNIIIFSYNNEFSNNYIKHICIIHR